MRKLLFLIILSAIVGCANMDSRYIDGGWFDESPPKVVSASPADKQVNIRAKNISIVFDEYIKIENATENVIISPPQIEPAEIKTKGKKIVVELKDSLKANTTYTIDFSDAITDNNEGNPLGNYTYSFSTGEEIDTLEVSGYVLDAETLEPIQGILVGLYDASDAQDDSIFMKKPFMRVARSDQNGHFVVKGVKEGEYKIYALRDQDNNFMLTPNSGEMMAFYDATVKPSVFDDFRQDTVMLDSLRIKSIDRMPYKHFIPDDVMLMTFSEPQTNRAFLKAERREADHFTMFFSYGDSIMPEIRGMNFNTDDAFIIEKNIKQDTITYWLKDTTLVNNDSLEIAFTYRMTDTLGILQNHTDTIMLLSKMPYAKRMKERQKTVENWKKQQEKNKKRGLPYDSIMPPSPLKIDMQLSQSLDPDRNITMTFPTPLAEVDTSKIHLYIEHDSIWYNAEWKLREKPNTNIRTMELLAEWQPECKYSFETDSAAFIDIYGKASEKQKRGFIVKSLNEYGTFEVTLQGMSGENVIVQLLERGDKLVKEVFTDNGVAKFYYMPEKSFYMRAIVDSNNNHVWDTGCFADSLQPEQVYYYPKEIKCRAKWNITENWDMKLKPRNEQKPGELRKNQSTSKQRRQTGRNLKRAQDLGIDMPEYLRR